MLAVPAEGHTQTHTYTHTLATQVLGKLHLLHHFFQRLLCFHDIFFTALQLRFQAIDPVTPILASTRTAVSTGMWSVCTRKYVCVHVCEFACVCMCVCVCVRERERERERQTERERDR